MSRLDELKNFLYNVVYEQYGWLPHEDDYSDDSKIEHYKENFIKKFKEIYGCNINENAQEFHNIIETVKNI